jgi:hypothetical protein
MPALDPEGRGAVHDIRGNFPRLKFRLPSAYAASSRAAKTRSGGIRGSRLPRQSGAPPDARFRSGRTKLPQRPRTRCRPKEKPGSASSAMERERVSGPAAPPSAATWMLSFQGGSDAERSLTPPIWGERQSALLAGGRVPVESASSVRRLGRGCLASIPPRRRRGLVAAFVPVGEALVATTAPTPWLHNDSIAPVPAASMSGTETAVSSRRRAYSLDRDCWQGRSARRPPASPKCRWHRWLE